MTEQQAKQIREMREQGIGYRSIALTVGLSRDIVRNFCKSRGLSGYGSALTKNIQEQVMLGKACLYCGKEMKQLDTGRPKKFCSDKCRREWWKGHPERINRKESAMYPAVCVRCGKEFLSYGNRKRKYCSHDCYIKAGVVSVTGIEKVKKLTVRVVVQDCTGTVRFTDVMLQGGSVATAWVSHVSEQRYTFDAQEV